MPIRYGSVCSGVEAATLAWQPLGWQPVFFSEIEPFPCAVLHARYDATRPINALDPEAAATEKEKKLYRAWNKQNATLPENGTIPNEGDFTKIGKKYHGKFDLLVGGTPCQDLSVAGKRAGFGGKRSSLALDFIRLAYESGCKWIVWENVPGVFSSRGGGTSQPFYPCFPEAQLKSPTEDLPPQDLFAMLDATDTVWHGACWTHNLPEFPDFLSPYPNGGGVCSLSDILEIGPVPRKYYLSRTACNGILRRASKRGKSLPAMLEIALNRQAGNIVPGINGNLSAPTPPEH